MRFSLALVLGLVAALLSLPVSAGPDSAEITYWESVRDSKTPAELEAYLKAYPDGAFAPLARIRLKALQEGEAKSATPAPASAEETAKPPAAKDEAPFERLTLSAKLAKREINGVQRTILGIQISDLSESQRSCFRVPEATGVLAQEVLADSPASAAGIHNGDIIQEIDGKPLKTARALVDLVTAQPAGVSTKVKVLRPRALRDGAKELKDRATASDADADAMECLAFVQMNGIGVKKDLAEANLWYRKAAEAGNTSAMFNFANHLANGTGIAKDVAEANRWYRKAAEAGNGLAMYNLGLNIETGNGITKDVAEANRWYRKAAEAGIGPAMVRLAFRLGAGKGITKDAAEASRWYRKAAEGGNVVAMYNLAVALQAGIGIAKDPAEALRWYRKAADHGDADAMYGLGSAYENGIGVAQDSLQAAQWTFKAIKGGSDYAVKVMRENSASFSETFRRELQRQLREAGRYDGEIDGDLGAGTLRAIEALHAAAKKMSQSAAPTQPAAPPASPPPDLGNVKDLDTLE